MWLYVAVFIVALCLIDWLKRIPWVSGLHKKCVVITGCDSGFGNALAKSLYRRGVYVFAGCYTDGGAKKLTEETGERVRTFKVDIAKTESIEKAFLFVEKELPKDSVLWGLVNNAGVLGCMGPSEVITRDDMLSVMNVNCFGTAEMVRVFLPLLKKSHGRIVNTSSVAGIVAGPGLLPYGVSKFALVGYSEALRHEKAVWGISVSTVAPGGFATPIINRKALKDSLDKRWNTLDPTIKEELGQDYYEHMFKLMTKNVDNIATPDLSPVVNSYENALFARFPRSMYYPGMDSAIVVRVQRWMPWLIDHLFKKLWKKAIPKAVQKAQ